ncbi:MAG TPA: permease prefix domain 1-containing protein [Candidatus Acidoferrales bacterium]|nr:permease prefix domain 1-containing protein [Candidatus Acidoferrales bacterium]
MRDWEALVEQHLIGLALEPTERAEVIAELAAHLEESCEELRRQGMTEEEAVRRTLSQVEDWQKLSRLIQTARTKENIMTDRVKQFWLPSLLTLSFSMGLLALIQVFGPNPWLVARKNGWTLVAPVTVVYLPWLLSLPLIGAMGAYLSNRAGGSQRAMFSSIVFPVLPYLVFFLVAFPVMAIFNERLAHTIMFGALFVGLFAWVLAPGAALLAGGLLAQFFFSRRLDSRRVAGS